MALVLADRVLETCTSPGTGAVSLLGAVTGYQAFSAAVGNGNTCYYAIADQNGANWEVGIGTYSTAGNSLARTTVLASSNGGSLTNFASGSQNVFLTYPATKAVSTDTLAYPPAIGSTTPNTGSFTTLTATGVITHNTTTNNQSYTTTGAGTITLTSGTAGSINNFNIGATTPGTGAFTTLSASGTITLSGGTANGILYLNGSKAVTSGTALTFDGTNFATTGSVTSAGLSDSGNLTFTGTGNRITGDFSNATIANRVAFQSSTTNGNTLPILIPNGTATASGILAFNGTDTANSSWFGLYLDSSATYITSTKNGTGAYLPLTFSTGASERMRLDTSGNLGLGVTPSAWSGVTAFELKGSSHIAYASSVGSIDANAYYVSGTGYIYKTTDYASQYQQNGGQHRWYNAPSGTAGTAITFTQAMTLDASGNLLVGKTTTGAATLGWQLSAVSSNAKFDTGQYFIMNRDTDDILINFRRSNTSVGTITVSSTATSYYTSTTSGIVGVDASTIGFNTGSSERMRIDSSGNVGIGTSSPSVFSGYTTVSVNNATNGGIYNILVNGTETARLQAYSGVFNVAAKGASTVLTFETNGSERMRIDSSGNVGIGTSSPSVKLAVSSTDAILVPVGTTAQRPTAATGYLRFNTTTTSFEGYNGTAWGSIGGATLSNDTTTATALYPLFANATTGAVSTLYTSNGNLNFVPSTGELSADAMIANNGLFMSTSAISASYTIAATNNAGSFGPVSVASGVTITVSSGSVWTVV